MEKEDEDPRRPTMNQSNQNQGRHCHSLCLFGNAPAAFETEQTPATAGPGLAPSKGRKGRMELNSQPFVSTAPCRICLFGEHQDYLGYPVIACGIPLLCRITVKPTPGSNLLHLEIPQIGATKCYDLDKLADTSNEDPDFALAAIHVVIASGWKIPCGARCSSSVELPMQAGVSTSSAFVVAWINTLSRLAGKEALPPIELAKLAFQAEVGYFHAPGGNMDHVACACGGLQRIGGEGDPWDVKSLRVEDKESFGSLILAYSGEPKDTLGHLNRCKTARLELLEKLSGDWDNNTVELCDDEIVLLQATRTNRDTEKEAYALWRSEQFVNKGQQLGKLLNKHHNALRDGLGLSTPILESMSKAALDAGAWGFKVVGSGGGGCGVAWVPNALVSTVEQVMRDAGSVATWIVTEPSSAAVILNG